MVLTWILGFALLGSVGAVSAAALFLVVSQAGPRAIGSVPGELCDRDAARRVPPGVAAASD